MNAFYIFFVTLLGKSVAFFCRLLRVGGGTTLPGRIVLFLIPGFIKNQIVMIKKNIIIAGSNGKTTTTSLLSHLLRSKNINVLNNFHGSNLKFGIASSLINASNLLGRIKDIDIGVWEVDERALNSLFFDIKPSILVLLNLHRDQLDRYGEIDKIILSWERTLSKADWYPLILINNDCNNTAQLSIHSKSCKTSYFHISGFTIPNELIFSVKQNTSHSTLINGEVLENLGLHGSRIDIQYPKEHIELTLGLPGLYQTYNLLAAFAAYHYLGLPLTDLQAALVSFNPPFGRSEHIMHKKREIFIFLLKNATSANQIFQTIIPEIKAQDQLMFASNDLIADGTDISWFWDADFELLTPYLNQPKRLANTIYLSGSCALDLAVRFKYADVNLESVLINTNMKEALTFALEYKKSHTKNPALVNRLFILVDYTGLLELQNLLHQFDVIKTAWHTSR